MPLGNIVVWWSQRQSSLFYLKARLHAPRLLESSTAVEVYLNSVGSMQHKLIRPNRNDAHSICSMRFTLQTIKSAIPTISYAFHNCHNDSYDVFATMCLLAHSALFNLYTVYYIQCHIQCMLSILHSVGIIKILHAVGQWCNPYVL
jgi:hypothetical protein